MSDVVTDPAQMGDVTSNATEPAVETTPAEAPKVVKRKGGWAAGVKRAPEDVARAKQSRAFTAAARKNPSKVIASVKRALKTTGGRGPAMLEAFAEELKREHGVTLAAPALRGVIDALVESGDLRWERAGVSNLWSLPTLPQKAAPRPGAPRAAAPTAKARGAASYDDVEASDEIAALSNVFKVLSPLTTKERTRVLAWASARFELGGVVADVPAVPPLPAPVRASGASPAPVRRGRPPAAAPAKKGKPGRPAGAARVAAKAVDDTEWIANKGQVNEARALMKKRAPRTDMARLLCLIQFIGNQSGQRSASTREVTLLARSLGWTFTNASATARAALDKNQLARAGDGWRLTPQGERSVEGLPGTEPRRGRPPKKSK